MQRVVMCDGCAAAAACALCVSSAGYAYASEAGVTVACCGEASHITFCEEGNTSQSVPYETAQLSSTELGEKKVTAASALLGTQAAAVRGVQQLHLSAVLRCMHFAVGCSCTCCTCVRMRRRGCGLRLGGFTCMHDRVACGFADGASRTLLTRIFHSYLALG